MGSRRFFVENRLPLCMYLCRQMNLIGYAGQKHSLSYLTEHHGVLSRSPRKSSYVPRRGQSRVFKVGCFAFLFR
jgi:hypothetical protein